MDSASNFSTAFLHKTFGGILMTEVLSLLDKGESPYSVIEYLITSLEFVNNREFEKDPISSESIFVEGNTLRSLIG